MAPKERNIAMMGYRSVGKKLLIHMSHIRFDGTITNENGEIGRKNRFSPMYSFFHVTFDSTLQLHSFVFIFLRFFNGGKRRREKNGMSYWHFDSCFAIRIVHEVNEKWLRDVISSKRLWASKIVITHKKNAVKQMTTIVKQIHM